VKAVALEALAFRRADIGNALDALLASEDPSVLSASLRAGRTSKNARRGQVERALLSPVPEVRDAAIETGLVLGYRSAIEQCRKVAQARRADAGPALSVLALGGDATDLQTIEAALETPSLRRPALFALGFSGWVGAADLCVRSLDDPKLGRLAGEAFSAITGRALVDEFRVDLPDEGDGEEDDDGSEPVPFVETNLPLPNADAVRGWWEGHRKSFAPGVRHICGRPFCAEALLSAFKQGAMRRRQLLGLELAVRSRGEFQVETRGWAVDQLRAERRPFTTPSRFNQPFSRLLVG